MKTRNNDAVQNARAGVFVSYRRDSFAITHLIDMALVGAFGRPEVFRDIYSIAPGKDFHSVIGEALAQCEVLLVVIGRGWATRRLFSPDDFVRLEIEMGLSQEMVVLPVLVEETQLPRVEDLPASLQPLLRLQAATVSSGRDFDTHLAWLVHAITRIRAARIDASQDYGPPVWDALESARREAGVAGPAAHASRALQRIHAEQGTALAELRGRIESQDHLRAKAKRKRREAKARRARAAAADAAVERFIESQDASKQKADPVGRVMVLLAVLGAALLAKRCY